MAKIYNSILELVGNTPVVKLNKIEQHLNLETNLYAKIEYFNPGGSVKDRIALNMIKEAIKNNDLKEGSTIIEGTSGNTGIGICMVSAALGFKSIICMPENMSKERVALMKAYGAKVYLTPKEQNLLGSVKLVSELAVSINDSFVPGQGSNKNNPLAHYKSTGEEIWDDMDHNIDILVCTIGTGGTISGTGKYLKEQNPNIKVIGVEPASCPVFTKGYAGPHKIQGIGGGRICEVTDQSIIDEILCCSDSDAYLYANISAKQEGILIGISSGAALWGATFISKREENKNKRIVVIFPDSGQRYLSSDLYE